MSKKEILHEYYYGKKHKQITSITGLKYYCAVNKFSFLDLITAKYKFKFLVWNKEINDYKCLLCQKELTIKNLDFENKEIHFKLCFCNVDIPRKIVKERLLTCFSPNEIDSIYDDYKKNKMKKWTTEGIPVASLEFKIQKFGEEEGKSRYEEINSKRCSTTNLKYYINKGHSEDEAKKILKDRQTTFSLEKCIAKYGVEEGQKRWNKRQEKWQETLALKSQQEINEINRKKISGCVSKISQELFKLIDIEGSRWSYKNGEVAIQLSSGKYVYPDFILDNKIIEFYGDKFHANPLFYRDGETVNAISKSISVGSTWKNDYYRIRQLENLGYQILIIWEYDFRYNKSKTLEICNKFLCRQ